MTDPMMKLYAGLTDQERGKLAYTHMVQGNELEQKRIDSVMPEQYFVGLPDGYRRIFINLNNLTMTYSIAYWQKVAQCLTFAAGTAAKFYDPDPEAYKPVMKRFEAAEAALMAIEQAFDDTCLEHGLDRDVMRFMAGNQFYDLTMPDLKPDEVWLTGYREIFASSMAF